MATDLEKKIITQIEYYFGDINYPRDKFMQDNAKVEEGWIPIEVLLTFKRLANLTTDSDVIADALKKSEAGLVDVSEDRKKLRRSVDKPPPANTEDRRKELTTRTAYAKGFPLDETLDDIIAFLEPHGPVESCAKRQYNDKATKESKFKGSCFIIFKDVDTCKKFIEEKSIKYKDVELIRKWQSAYIQEKKDQYCNHRKDKKKKKQDAADEQAPPEKKIEFPKGAVLHFSGVEEGKILTREEIKERIAEIGEIEASFIDYAKGDAEGYVRLPVVDSAQEVFKKMTDGELKIGENKLKFKVLEGDEETKFLEKSVDAMIKRRQLSKKVKRGNKRRGNFGDREPPAKKAKN